MAAKRPRQPDPEPMKMDITLVLSVGVALWLIALVVLALFGSELVPHGRDQWMWTCVAGAGLGLVGIPYGRHLTGTGRRDRATDRPRRPSS